MVMLMNDEIKEILDKWKCYIELTNKFTTNEYEMLRVEDIEKALDYITNLQRRNNNLVEDFKRHVDRINELTERSDNLQQENEKLSHQLEVQRDLTIKNRLRKHIYKSRCEKASDNLKRNYWINEHEHNDDVVNMTLNILQNGSDDNE